MEKIWKACSEKFGQKKERDEVEGGGEDDSQEENGQPFGLMKITRTSESAFRHSLCPESDEQKVL